MKKLLIVISLALLCLGGKASYINYLSMNTAIRNTLEEHSRQQKIKNNQLVVTQLEGESREKFSTFKETYRKIEARMNSLGLLIDAGVLVTDAVPLVSSITRSQGEILELVVENPQLGLSAIEVEKGLATRAGSILRYMAGVLLTYGDINRMKPSRRKLLLNFARDELRALDGQSYRLLTALRQRLQLSVPMLNVFADWVSEDKKLISEILKNAKTL